MQTSHIEARGRRWGIRAGLTLTFGAAAMLAAGLVAAQADRSPEETKAMVERGKYLINIGGCNDCHTPWIMTANGPRSDSTRFLSGHPADLKVTMPKLEMPWMAAATATFTAWAGPWGISYSANLTPDSSGLGIWTEEMFIQALRTGKHWGVSRPIMPPMPWENVAKLPDADLKAMYAFLRTIPPIHNVVPDYEPPADAPAGGGHH